MTRWSCWRLRMYVDTLNGAGGGNNDVGSNWWWWCSSDDAGVVEDTKKYIRVTRLRHWTEWNWLEASLLTTKATWYKPCAFSSRCYRVLRVAAARATTALSVPQPDLFPLLRASLLFTIPPNPRSSNLRTSSGAGLPLPTSPHRFAALKDIFKRIPAEDRYYFASLLSILFYSYRNDKYYIASK